MKIKSIKKGLLKRLTAFLILPLIFVFISYITIYFIASPIIAPISSFASMLIGDDVPTFTEQIVDEGNVDLVIDNSKIGQVISVDKVKFPEMGEKYAHITIPNTGVDYDVYYGDSNAILRKGPGQYNCSKMPGFGSTTLVAGHVTTHFRGLRKVKIGDIIYYNTTYGAYEYKVTEIKIAKATEAESVFDLRADHDNLVLYTCYPFHAVAFRSERYFVLAEKISGPEVNIYVD